MALARGDQAALAHSLEAGGRAMAAGAHLFGVDILLWGQAGWMEAAGMVGESFALLSSVLDQTVRTASIWVAAAAAEWS